VVLSGLALWCPAALGATVTVNATGADVFDPSSITITQGDTVTWKNDGMHPHNVHFEEFTFVMPDPFSSSTWMVSNTFAQSGVYHYYCEVHGGVGGQGMSGTVTVNAAPAGGGGGGGGGGPTGPGPGADTAPVSSLAGPKKQDVDKLFVRASMNEAGTLSATGSVSVPGGAAKVYKLERTSKSVAANAPVKLRLKLSKKALKAVKRALLRKKKLFAKVTLTAKDATAHRTLRKQKIRLTN
jgi:plastocyanin